MTFLEDVGSDTEDIFSDEFSEPVSISYKTETEVIEIPTTGIFDETFAMVDGDGMEVISTYPRVSIWAKTIEEKLGFKIGYNEDLYWKVTVRGVTYRVKVPKPDDGQLVMELKNVA